MQKIRFIGSNSEYKVSLAIQSHRIICVFRNEEEASTAPLSAGFIEINEHNGIVQSDYSDYRYIYKKGADKASFILTNDISDVYVEPKEPESIIPDVEEYIPSIEEIKSTKISFLSSICNKNIIDGVDVEINGVIEHFSYKDEDQINIKELFDLAVQTNVPMYYHADGCSCKEYSVEQIIAIYSAASANKNHHTTYFNQLKMYINSLETKEEVEAVVYGQELTGEYLDTYNASMAQAQLVLDALLAKRVSAYSEG